MDPNLHLNHLNLPAKDPNALREWYVSKLGFRPRGRFLWSAGTLLVFVEGTPLASEQMHFGFRVESLAELHDWVERLRERGVEAGPIEGDDQYSTVFILDPEGNKFEIFYEPVPF